jgi:undecaprenyl-diphosphatase
VGTSVWFLYYKLSRRFSWDSSFISSHYTSTGYLLTDVDVVITVMVLTLLYAILRATMYLYW